MGANEHEGPESLRVLLQRAIDRSCVRFFGDFGAADSVACIDGACDTHRRYSVISTSSDSAVHRSWRCV